MKRRYILGAAALGIGGAAVAGFGAAMGRDAWKATKKNRRALVGLVLIACVIALPFWGGKNLSRGYPEGRRVPIFSSVLLIVGGGVSALLLHIGKPLLFSIPPSELTSNQLLFMVGLVAASTGAGLLYGMIQKPGRLRTFAIADYNEWFLDQFGFEELDGDEVTHIDGDGNPLRLIESNDRSIVFFAVGRRNRRAYIKLSPEGQMLGYTGVIAISDPREYVDPEGHLLPA